MITGWFTDVDGYVYYLNPVSDNMQGAMFTGWYWIAGKCYYFSEVKTDVNPGGSLMKNATTPDNYVVNGDGAWEVNGVIQVQ